MRIALVQLAPRLACVDENLALHEQHLTRLSEDAVDLVIFPELSLTGYFLRDLVPDVALHENSAPLRRIAELSRGRTVVVGFVHETPDHRFYNAAAVFSDGTLRGIHHKVYLPTYGMFDEQRYWAPGRRLRSFETLVGRLGVLICEDVCHLSTVVLLQLHRVDLAVFIANSPLRKPTGERPASLETWYTLNSAAALCLQAPVAFVNRAGCEEGVTFAGGSAFFGPEGDLLQAAGTVDEDVMVVEYDPHQTRSARIATPLLRDENAWFTYHELKRLLDVWE